MTETPGPEATERAARSRPMRARVTGEGTVGWHEQVAVVTPDGTTVDVDTAIAPLLVRLWAEGYRTRASCQSARNSGWVWVLFTDAGMATRFADALPADRLPQAEGMHVTFRRAPTLDPGALLSSG
jgi:hypothetical protein